MVCFRDVLGGHRKALKNTRNDKKRPKRYAENVSRLENLKKSNDINDYLNSLNMHLDVKFVTEIDEDRVTQLINKTNHKNLNLSIEGVISNHNDLKNISSLENLPFYYFPIHNDKLNQEKRIIEFIHKKNIDKGKLVRKTLKLEN